MAEQSLHADSLVFKIASSLFVMMQQKPMALYLLKLMQNWVQSGRRSHPRSELYRASRRDGRFTAT